MTNLWRSLTRASDLTVDEWANYFNYNGLSYPFLQQTLTGNGQEEVPGNFRGFAEHIYKANGIVFACMLVRLLLFSEARFQFRQMQGGRPGDLFGTQALERLERPWPNGTTGDLLTRVVQDVDLAGNFYARRTVDGVERLRPDWVTILLGNERPNAEVGDLGTELAGYMYHPGGLNSGRDPVSLNRDEVAHFAPIPDPCASFRGMSWLTPVLREILADGAMTTHRKAFFENGATPNLVVKFPPELKKEAMEKWIAAFKDGHEGAANAYRTMFFGGGADVEALGVDLKEAEFKITQGAGETRIAAAAGVPPIIVGLSEGLAAATYSNYGQARRRLADGTVRPLWRGVSGSLATIVDVPAGAELWYDDRDIPFLQEDLKDAADIRQVDANAIKALTDAGYTPDSVINAITSGDLRRLQHSGNFSVQLHPPGTDFPSTSNGSSSNGAAPAGALAP